MAEVLFVATLAGQVLPPLFFCINCRFYSLTKLSPHDP